MNAQQIESMRTDLNRLHLAVAMASMDARLYAKVWPTWKYTLEDIAERLRSVQAEIYVLKESAKPD